MTTMQLITSTVDGIDSDEAIEAMFAAAGLTAEVVAHCDNASCPLCFAEVPARAA